MTQRDRAQLASQGKTILRAKFDGISKWEIYQYTKDGWIKAAPCGCWCDSRAECDAIIDSMVAKFEDIVKDE
jgi:hypothetical protein